MATKNDSKTTALKVRHRTTPLPDSLSPVPGYPRKLSIYKLEASSYWWVRYYIEGKIVRRSTKTDDKNKAYSFAKNFFNELELRRSQGLAVRSKTSFDACALAMLVSMEAQVSRKEITQITYDINKYRLNKTILPFFKRKDVADINYELLEKFLHSLSKASDDDEDNEPLSSSTINGYMKLVRKVLNYAFRHRYIQAVPTFPAVAVKDNARGFFTTTEYRLLWERARKLNGARFDLRKRTNKEGKELKAEYALSTKKASGRLIRRVAITKDLHELVVFMVNSFLRPTDIKNLQHKHVEVIRGDHTYLRLNLPTSKKHDAPVVTMRLAVRVYERLKRWHKSQKHGVGADDYVFLPQYKKRDYAMKELQRQFDVLLWSTKLGKGPKGEDRTMYSLRHTCIMYRLMYGEGMDVVTLARNARTSAEMIDRFYASRLQGEMNIGLLQSRRKKTKRKTKTEINSKKSN